MHSDSTFEFRPKKGIGKLYGILILVVAIGSLGLAAMHLQGEILSAVRAYVQGEGLWSKAQKNAMQNLLSYARTHDERFYAGFERNMRVQLGDERARLELQKAEPDFEVARQGFIAGGNDPDDVEGMIWLFRAFRRAPQLAKAVAIWTEGDREMALLHERARALHAEISREGAGSDTDRLVAQLESQDRRLGSLEEEFEATLGDAARWVTRISSAASVIFGLLILSTGVPLTWYLVRNAHRVQRELALSEARFRRLAESNIIATCFWHTNGRVLDANDAFLRLAKLDRADLRADRVTWRTSMPAAGGFSAAADASGRREEGGQPFETEWIRSDGVHVPILVAATYLKEQHDHGVAYVQDLTGHERAEAERRLSATMVALESAPDAMVIVDSEGRIVLVNSQTEKMFGYTREELLQREVEILLPQRIRDRHPAHRRNYLLTPRLREMGCGQELFGLRKDGTEIPIEIALSPMDTENGLLVYSAIRDISDRKQAERRIQESLREKEILLKEIHHRVKNNLAVMSSMFHLQSTYTDDANVIRILSESQSRVRSMSLVHETLYQSGNLQDIDFGQYANDLATELIRHYESQAGKVTLKTAIDNFRVNIDLAVPFGLVLNELVTNSLKHAFPERRGGRLTISMERLDGGRCALSVTDDGVGLPAGFDAESSNTLGLRVVRALARQVDAVCEFSSSGGGTTVRLVCEGYEEVRGGAASPATAA